MNILFLNSYPAWGGGETWMLDVAEGLRGRGHQCLIAGHERRAWYIHTKELGWNPQKVNIRGDIAPFILAQLHRIEKKHHINLVVCNFDKEARLAALARGSGRNPVIVTMKGLPLMRGDNVFCRWSYRRLIDHTVVCANFIYRDFARYPWLDMKKFSVIYNSLNVGKLRVSESSPGETRNEFNIGPSTKVIGAVARFVTRKGLHDLIDSAPMILRNHTDVKIVLVGDGIEKQPLRLRAQQLGVYDSIIFTGFREDLDRIFPIFDIFVLPSHSEGFPYVLQIAMFYAKPIVTTGVGGITDAIEHGVNGLIVPVRNPEVLADSVNRLLSDSTLAGNLGHNASKTLSTIFPYSGMIDKFETLFNHLVSETDSR
jgi:glycosyltransferase involved in cell wall biosynthesis